MNPHKNITSDAQALVMGLVRGLLVNLAADPNRSVLIDDVEAHFDAQHNYLSCVTVTMRSGVRLDVSVTVAA